MKRSSLIALAASLPPLGVLGLLMAFYLPAHERVFLTGTEIKRVDLDERAPGGGSTRDVRYILGRLVDGGEVRVYHNEDTRFGWPPYFKFNAVDLSAKAADLAKNHPDQVVLVTYYGWQINMLRWLPNAVEVEPIAPNERRFPWFNLVVVVLVYGGIFGVVFLLRRRFRQWLDRRRAAKAAEKTPKNGDESRPT